MSAMEIYEDERTVSRADLAAWLRQLASQLEPGGQIFYGAAGSVTVADQVHCELEIEREDGEISIEIEFSWTDPEPAGPPADSDGEADDAQTEAETEEEAGDAGEAIAEDTAATESASGTPANEGTPKPKAKGAATA